MKTKITHWYNYLAAASLSLLGFSSCGSSSSSDDDFICLYGSPTANFSIKGSITDEAGNPIPNIKVVVRQQYDGLPDMRIDSVRTDGDGRYETHDTGNYGLLYQIGNNPKQSAVILEDTDGEANGGEFANDSINNAGMTVKQIKPGDNSWYRGAYEVTANKTLKKKQ